MIAKLKCPQVHVLQLYYPARRDSAMVCCGTQDAEDRGLDLIWSLLLAFILFHQVYGIGS